MPDTKPTAFIDTNILLYLLSDDTSKADRAENIVQSGGIISVQVLNEITVVARRKLAMPWREIDEFISLIVSCCRVETTTEETHHHSRIIAERYGLNIYDAMIASSALLAGCKTLYSVDRNDGLAIESELRVISPFMS